MKIFRNGGFAGAYEISQKAVLKVDRNSPPEFYIFSTII
jgi:hypothetical protein